MWIANRECANCLKLQRILDRVNGKHCHIQCRAMTDEHMSEKGFGRYQQPKFAKIILDRVNGKRCHRQSRAKASEHICGLIMESMLTA